MEHLIINNSNRDKQSTRVMEKSEFSDSQIDALRALTIGDNSKSTSAIGSPHHGADNIKVLVRVRPFSEKEIADKNDFVVDIINDQALSVTNLEGKKSFQCSFDAVLGPSASQMDVYNVVKECTDSVVNGFNSTIFAYGQTGSGKTYSMYGPPAEPGAKAVIRDSDVSVGLIPRAINEIFDRLLASRDIIDFSVYCSFVQVYNENLFDMLRDSSMAAPLAIREDKKEIYVQGLSEYNVKSVVDTLQLLKVAEDNRAIRETYMNQFSSRSHSIFQVLVEHKRLADDGTGEISLRAKFNLVDLAGSEKWNTRLYMKDEHIAEMTNINLSLHTLGKCISALAQASIQRQKELSRLEERAAAAGNSVRSSQSSVNLTANSLSSSTKEKSAILGGNIIGVKDNYYHIPFRESKLTRLLQDSLGGNSKTFLLATISPAKVNCEESISTLKFADRAKQVMVQAVLNETRPIDHAFVKRLQQEVISLKALLRKVMEHKSLQALLPSNPTPGGVDEVNKTNINIDNAVPIASPTIQQQQQQLQQQVLSPVHKLKHKEPDNQFFLTEDKDHDDDDNGTSDQRKDANSNVLYVETIEKALNKEQIHSQHLTQKNETLIKELEELKSIHKQRNMMPCAPTKDTMFMAVKDCEQMVNSLREMDRRSGDLWSKVDAIQKIMKKFFKFQIEEEDMKDQITQIFGEIKDMRSLNGGGKDETAHMMVEFLQGKMSDSVTHAASAGSKGHSALPIIHSGISKMESPKPNLHHHQNQNHTQQHRASSEVGSNTLPQIKDSSSSSSSSSAGNHHSKAGRVATYSSGTASHNSRHHGDIAESSGHVDPVESSGALAFRVRGGPPGGGAAGEVGMVRTSSDSVGGWGLAPYEEEKAEEDRLRRELKQAKKKQKQQQKMQEWMREKEEKAMLEAKQQEEEKKAMQEAEELREQRRKDYARKQKEKLLNYQKNFITEAGKIQELMDLGIDPQLLMKS